MSDHEAAFRLVGYIIGPFFAVIGFIWTRIDKHELNLQHQRQGELREKARAAQEAAQTSRQEADKSAAEAKKLLQELEGITTGADQLWKLRPAKPFPLYRTWYLEPGAKLITIGNLKGGVGKTTLAANFGAYLSETRCKNVLLVDLDYQGSLSQLLLLALGRDETESRVNALFTEDAGLPQVLQSKLHLVPEREEIENRMSRGWLVPAGYEYARLENQLLLAWLLNKDGFVDVRYRLAQALLRPEVRQEFDVIIFDMPPRLTMGAINALVASHYFFVPTNLDKIAVETVPQFLSNVKGIKEDLNLGIELGGIIGTLTKADLRSGPEEAQFNRARDAGAIWSKDEDYMLPRTVPHRTAISHAAGESIAYLQSDGAKRRNVREIFDPLFEDMCFRIRL